MPELHFQIEAAEAVPHAAAPLIALKLRITNLPASEEIHTLTLRCQVQIEPAKRRYVPQEQEKLLDLFGTPERWSRTVRPLLWMNTTVAVPGFTDNVLVDLQLPCTFDFNVAATKYFHALDTGEIPVCVMFSGTVFYQGADGALQVAQVPWDREANFRLPISVWKEMMEMHFPNTAWLCLRRDVFEQLYQYKVRHGIPTWEQAISRALAAEDRRGEGMNFDGAEKIAAAILYEGYILYPYRPTAIKNRQRWNFGTLYPRVYAEAQRPQEPFRLVAECLAVADAQASLDVRISFLQLVPTQSDDKLTDPSLAWDEAVERNSEHAGLRVRDLIASPLSLTVKMECLRLELSIGAEILSDGVSKLHLEIQNMTELPSGGGAKRDEALPLSFVSAHVLLGITGGEFVSLLDPDPAYREAVAACCNTGVFPVLVGEEPDTKHDVLLADHLVRLSEDRARERRRLLRWHGDGRDAHPARAHPHGR